MIGSEWTTAVWDDALFKLSRSVPGTNYVLPSKTPVCGCLICNSQIIANSIVSKLTWMFNCDPYACISKRQGHSLSCKVCDPWKLNIPFHSHSVADFCCREFGKEKFEKCAPCVCQASDWKIFPLFVQHPLWVVVSQRGRLHIKLELFRISWVTSL